MRVRKVSCVFAISLIFSGFSHGSASVVLDADEKTKIAFKTIYETHQKTSSGSTFKSPSSQEILEIQRSLRIKFHPLITSFLKKLSGCTFEDADFITANNGKESDLVKVIKNARECKIDKDWIPFNRVQGSECDFFNNKTGEIKRFLFIPSQKDQSKPYVQELKKWGCLLEWVQSKQADKKELNHTPENDESENTSPLK